MSKNKAPSHGWILAFATLMTGLFALFAGLFAINKKSYDEYRESEKPKAIVYESGEKTSIDLKKKTGDIDAAQEEETGLDRSVQKHIEESLLEKWGEKRVSQLIIMDYEGGELRIRFLPKLFYRAHRVEPVGEAAVALDDLLRVVSETRRKYRIDGHADFSEKATTSYQNSWELSAARASWVAERMIQQLKVPASRISVSAFAHHRPMSRGKMNWQESANRRIEIVIR